MSTVAFACLALVGLFRGDEGGARRDPFVRPGSGPSSEVASCAASGLRRMRARDLAVRGIVRSRESVTAPTRSSRVSSGSRRPTRRGWR